MDNSLTTNYKTLVTAIKVIILQFWTHLETHLLYKQPQRSSFLFTYEIVVVLENPILEAIF